MTLPTDSPSPQVDLATHYGVIPISLIDADPAHPRIEPDSDPLALERLTQSLQTYGQLQAIVVRESAQPGRYTIVAGLRRWQAAVLAGLPTLDALVIAHDTSHTLELQLVENLVREDLNPIDQAYAFRSLMERHQWCGSRLAAEMNLSQSTVSRALSLLNLPAPIQQQVADGRLAPSIAQEIARIDDPERQTDLATRAHKEGLNRSEVRREREAGKTRSSRRSTDNVPVLVFQTTIGRVTIEPRSARGDHHDVIEALLQVIEQLQDLRDDPEPDEEDMENEEELCTVHSPEPELCTVHSPGDEIAEFEGPDSPRLRDLRGNAVFDAPRRTNPAEPRNPTEDPGNEWGELDGVPGGRMPRCHQLRQTGAF